MDEKFSIEPPEVVRALFYGLGADGTVGANKDSIKIIGENTNNYAQGYFVYDSKKSGAITISHLRFGPKPIRSTYLITHANFVACHQPIFLERMNVSECLVTGGTLLLNSPHKPEEVWKYLPPETQRDLIAKKAKVYTIDAMTVARAAGMGGRINTVMQTCFFSVSGVLPPEEAITAIKESIKKTYGKKGEEIVRMNIEAVDKTLAHLFAVAVPDHVESLISIRPPVPAQAPAFVRNVLGTIAAGGGDRLPVSAMPCDGTFPTDTARWEKRNLATEVPVWDSQVCIQCGKCVFVCPHATIRSKVYDPTALNGAPERFKSTEARLPEWKGQKFTIQVAVEDCTGCGVCVDVCPARNKSEAKLKAINMRPQPPLREAEVKNWDFFLGLPELDRRKVIHGQCARDAGRCEPLFEFSGACAGCGETPYLKLLTQLFGDRMIVANATGCSSIYGGNLPTTPWAQNADGRGPAWWNSLFEDNAEFGLGFRVSHRQADRVCRRAAARTVAPRSATDLVETILHAPQKDEADIFDQRERVVELKQKTASGFNRRKRHGCSTLADTLVRKSVWIVGGDGWGYDIGYGGLDHVLASGRNVKVLLLDTEVYSNTGGQMLEVHAARRGGEVRLRRQASAKKDLGLIAMTYGNIYVASRRDGREGRAHAESVHRSRSVRWARR